MQNAERFKWNQRWATLGDVFFSMGLFSATLRIIGPSYRGVWICIAGFRDLQTPSFEIPWFIGNDELGRLGRLVLWIPIGSPKMKAIGILRGTPIQITNHWAPNRQLTIKFTVFPQGWCHTPPDKRTAERNLKIPTPLERQKTSTQTTNFGGSRVFLSLHVYSYQTLCMLPQTT